MGGRNDLAGTPDLDESVHGLVDLLARVGGRKLNADASLALGNDWVREADDVNVALEHVVGKLCGKAGVAEHDGDDRVVLALDHKAGIGHALAEVLCVFGELVTERGGGRELVKDIRGRRNNRWGDRVGEEVGTRALSQQPNHLFGARRVPTF